METLNGEAPGGEKVPPANAEDRVALVTGAASGIGRATAYRFASDGARVGCFDLDGAGVQQTAATIRDDGGEAFVVEGDVSDEVDAKAAVALTLEHFGAIDVLANVAGIGHFRHSAEESLDDWNRIVGVNLTGTFLMCRNALPALLERRGVIVNVASIAGLGAHPYAVAYSASKAGVIALTKTLAAEFAAAGLRVNAVAPGGVLTPILESFTPPEGTDDQLMGRAVPLNGMFVEPEEIANAIAFLSSETMPNTTGTVLVVDGATSA
ncbi:MAG: SDR family oxidoreductase [Acidimicrobiia bacterium]|nr:SDR family oxidoreductase [Acidimicrobiia bacterium]